jgi:hypothetical protein
VELSKQLVALLTGASVAALVAGAAQATPYRLETHGYRDTAGVLHITSTKVTPVGGHSRTKTPPTYTTYSNTYPYTATAPLKVETVVSSLGYFTQTSAGACIGYPAGKVTPAVTTDLNGSWKVLKMPAATIPYTGTAITCTGGDVITKFSAVGTEYKWTSTATVGATDVSSATFYLKTLDYGSKTAGFIENDTLTETVTYCGKPAKGTTTCPAAAAK